MQSYWNISNFIIIKLKVNEKILLFTKKMHSSNSIRLMGKKLLTIGFKSYTYIVETHFSFNNTLITHQHFEIYWLRVL